MNYYSYYYFTSLFDDKFCDNIIDAGLKEIEYRKSKNESTTGVTSGKHLTKQDGDNRQALNDKTFEDLGDTDTFMRLIGQKPVNLLNLV